MVKKIKLSKKMVKEEVCENFQKNLNLRFHVRCNLSHQEITEKIFSHCFVCKNFDELWEFKRLGYKFDSHSSDHLCELNIPNHIPLFSLDWNTKEEQKLLNVIRITEGQDWEKVSESLGSKNSFKCESNFFHSYLRKHNFPFFSRKRLFTFNKRFQKSDLLCKLIKIWIAIFDNKCNWVPQRGEKFFEWENEVEETLEKNFGKNLATDLELLSVYNKKLYQRELSRELFCRNELQFKKNPLKLKFSSKISGSVTRLEQVDLINRFKDIELVKIKKNKRKIETTTFFSIWLAGFPFLCIQTSEKIFKYFRKIYLKKPYKKKEELVTHGIYENKNLKFISKWVFFSEKEKLLSNYFGIFPHQLLFFKILVLFKKNIFDGYTKQYSLFYEKVNFLFFVGEIIENFFGINSFKKIKLINKN